MSTKLLSTFSGRQEAPQAPDSLVLSILQAHKNCQNMTEIEAKVSYVKLARSLKTYGVSFFLVKVRRSLVCQHTFVVMAADRQTFPWRFRGLALIG